MLKIGVILFAIGLLMLSPFDEIFILIPLSAVVGVWIIPVVIIIALLCFIVGAMLIGKHLVTELSNPLVLGMFALSILVILYMIYSSGWLQI